MADEPQLRARLQLAIAESERDESRLSGWMLPRRGEGRGPSAFALHGGALGLLDSSGLHPGDRYPVSLDCSDAVGDHQVVVLRRNRGEWRVVFPSWREGPCRVNELASDSAGRPILELVCGAEAEVQDWAIAIVPPSLAVQIRPGSATDWRPLMAAIGEGVVSVRSLGLPVGVPLPSTLELPPLPPLSLPPAPLTQPRMETAPATVWMLEIGAGIEQGWELRLGAAGRSGAGRGSQDATQVSRLLSATAALRSPPAVLRPTHEAALVRAETQVGGHLAALLAGSDGLQRSLGALLAPTGSLLPRVLLIDAAAPGADAVPWELLAGGPTRPPLEESGEAVIVRAIAGYSARVSTCRDGDELRVLVWCPTPEDAACKQILDALFARCRSAGLNMPHLLTASLPVLPDLTGGASSWVLHVICHGRVVESEVRLQGAGSELALGTFAALVSDGLAQVDLLVLDVCNAAASAGKAIDDLAGRLAAAGARCIVAPRWPVDRLAAAAFHQGLYAGLSAGRPIAESVALGRRQVRALRVLHPDSRWYAFTLLSADATSLSRPLHDAGWRPEGWPTPDPSVRRLLRSAHLLAMQDGLGFVGIEYLVSAATKERPAGAGWQSRLIRQLAGQSSLRVEALLDWEIVQAPPRLLPATPRLQRWGAKLEPGFGLDALWSCAVDDGAVPLQVLYGAESPRGRLAPPPTRGGPTGQLHSSPPPGEPTRGRLAQGLEVVGGPEDGRQIRFGRPMRLGRYDSDREPNGEAAVELYAATTAYSRSLSRHHLDIRADGQVVVRGGGELRPSGAGRATPVAPNQALVLFAGDVLVLGLTWLVAT